MSLRLERALVRRRTEIIMTFVLAFMAISLLVLSLGPLRAYMLVQLGEKVAFATLVALAVRWLTIIFSEVEHSSNSDDLEYHEAIKNANVQIWICQTWLPGIDRDAMEIIQSKVSNVRIMLASFKEGSPIYARIAGRRIEPSTARMNSASSVRPFIEHGRKDCLKFNHGHHVGWIAVIDSDVFWGPTPVHVDNHAIDFLFHKYPGNSVEGEFWTTQFKLLWDHHCHSLEEEIEYNEYLRSVGG
jgi:hypothetical protein